MKNHKRTIFLVYQAGIANVFTQLSTGPEEKINASRVRLLQTCHLQLTP